MKLDRLQAFALALPHTAVVAQWGGLVYKVAGKVFRIGHLGGFNELMLMGTLAGVEMGLHLAGVPHRQGGVAAAMDSLAGRAAAKAKSAAE